LGGLVSNFGCDDDDDDDVVSVLSRTFVSVTDADTRPPPPLACCCCDDDDGDDDHNRVVVVVNLFLVEVECWIKLNAFVVVVTAYRLDVNREMKHMHTIKETFNTIFCLKAV
jgi:hypothetical protein